MPFKDGKKWRATKMIDGRRRQKLFATKAEAARWEAAQDARAWAEETSQTLTALEWATAYLKDAEARLGRKTVLEKRRAFKALFTFVARECPASGLPPQGIREALAWRAASSGNAANKDRKNLGAAWQWGREALGFTGENPFLAVKRFAHDERAREVPTEEAFWAVHAQAGPEDKVFLLAALHTAARRGELFRLQWSDVDLPAGRIRLGTRKTKTGSIERAWLPMTTQLRAALEAHARTKRSLFVFSQEDGSPFTSKQHLMRALCRRAGVPRFGFHGIRHLTASILIKEGVDLARVQAILRHKSVTTTARYVRALGAVDTVLAEVFDGEKQGPRKGVSEGR